MATLNAGDPTLLDMVKRTDPNGSIAMIVEMLSKKNPILADAVAREGNLPTGHRFTTRNTLPAVGWRRYNDGIAPSKSITEQYDETCGMLEGFSYVDCGLAKLNGNEAAFRASEDKAFLSALNIEATRALMYANVNANPEQIFGLTPRFDLLSQSANVVSYATGGTSTNSSIWFVCWGEDTAYLIYPKGQVGGLQSEDLGKQLVDSGAQTPTTPNGKKYTAWVTHWMWNLGLCIQDSRQVIRLANLDSATIDTAAEYAVIVDKMIDAYYKLYDPNAGRLFLYTNRTVAAMLHKGAMQKASSTLSIDTYAGKPVTTFLGYPIRVVDGMLATEAAVA